MKKVSKYENKFAKLQKKAAEFNFRNQLKVVKKKEFTLEDEEKEVWLILSVSTDTISCYFFVCLFKIAEETRLVEEQRWCKGWGLSVMTSKRYIYVILLFHETSVNWNKSNLQKVSKSLFIFVFLSNLFFGYIGEMHKP